MKRNDQLIFKILTTVRDSKEPVIRNLEIPGFDQATVAEHAQLCIEAGYLDGIVDHYIDNTMQIKLIRRLTNAGHDYIEAFKG